MSGDLRYTTVESSREILLQLYLDNREEQFFTCTISVPLPRLDSVEDGTLKLDLKRLYDDGNSYEIANGDRIYRTRARFNGDLWEFDVDVITRSRQADLVGATISMAGEAVEIFEEMKRR